jgi:hypothetical protein
MSELNEYTHAESPLGADLIWSTAEIAKELRLPVRQTTHLVMERIIPTGKIGGRVVASRRKLREFLEAAVNGQAA